MCLSPSNTLIQHPPSHLFLSHTQPHTNSLTHTHLHSLSLYPSFIHPHTCTLSHSIHSSYTYSVSHTHTHTFFLTHTLFPSLRHTHTFFLTHTLFLSLRHLHILSHTLFLSMITILLFSHSSPLVSLPKRTQILTTYSIQTNSWLQRNDSFSKEGVKKTHLGFADWSHLSHVQLFFGNKLVQLVNVIKCFSLLGSLEVRIFGQW